METVYVVGLKSIFVPHFADFQNGIGHYYEVGFSNWGVIRYSNDGLFVLLEEAISKFRTEDLEAEGTQVFTLAEIRVYLSENASNWETEIL